MQVNELRKGEGKVGTKIHQELAPEESLECSALSSTLSISTLSSNNCTSKSHLMIKCFMLVFQYGKESLFKFKADHTISS